MRSFEIRRDVAVPMRDGVVLRADVWIPQASGPVPTLLQRLPYGKSSTFHSQHIVGLEPLRALDAGFAVVIQDVRGRGSSDGDFVPYLSETADGSDTIAWIRAQPFSNGQVGMYGSSYRGVAQLLAAMGTPEGLRAIAPQQTPSSCYRGLTYEGGALQLGLLLMWVVEALAPERNARLRDERARQRRDELLAPLLADPAAALGRLPVDRDDLAELEPSFREWLRHPDQDAFWARIDPSVAYDRMDVAGLHTAGWNDPFVDGNLRTYQGLRDNAPSEWARERQFLVVGPWTHANLSDWQGGQWLGYPASADSLDLTSVHTSFFKAALAGTPVETPRVRLFVMGENVWRDEDDWPLQRARSATYYLHGSNTAADDGRLTRDKPHSTEPPDRFVADPADPVPTAGGATFLPGALLGRAAGPMDQRHIEQRQDVFVYTSDVLAEDVEVTGEVRIELYAGSSAPDCDWTARLVDVHPDGRAYGVTDGIMRSRYRHGADQQVPLTPGKPERFEFSLGSTCQVFKSGHRIRLQIASSNFPRFDRNPQQLIPPTGATAGDLRAAHQTVYHDSARPSQLILPLIPR